MTAREQLIELMQNAGFRLDGPTDWTAVVDALLSDTGRPLMERLLDDITEDEQRYGSSEQMVACLKERGVLVPTAGNERFYQGDHKFVVNLPVSPDIEDDECQRCGGSGCEACDARFLPEGES